MPKVLTLSSVNLNPPNTSVMPMNGKMRGTASTKPSSSYHRIANRNSRITTTGSRDGSKHTTHHPTTVSSTSTAKSVLRQHHDVTWPSMISTNTHISKPPSPATLVTATLPPKRPRTEDPVDETNGTSRESKRSKFPATGSTKDAVLQLLASVNTSTSAPIAEKAAMLWRNAPIHLIGLEPPLMDAR